MIQGQLPSHVFHNQPPISASRGLWAFRTVHRHDSRRTVALVSHAASAVVLDLATEKVIGEIPDTPGAHGIARVPQRGNGRDNNMTIIDLKTLKATGQVPAAPSPDAIYFDANASRVVGFNGR